MAARAGLGVTTDRMVVLAAGLYATAVVAAGFMGILTYPQTILATAAPATIALAVAAPGWLLYLFLAIPPGIYWIAPWLTPRTLILMAFALGIVWWLLGRRVAFPTGALPYLVLLAAVGIHQVGGTRPEPATELMISLVWYAVLTTAAFILVRSGTVSARGCAHAVVASAAGSAIMLVLQVGGDPGGLLLIGERAPELPAWLFYRTHFGYFMAAGFVASLPYALGLGDRETRGRWIWVTAGLGLLVALSLTRGAWVIAVTMLAALLWSSRRRAYVVVLAVALALAATMAPVSERLTGAARTRSSRVIEARDPTTGRAQLWSKLIPLAAEELPEGHGFGYVWSLTSEDLFDTPRVFTSRQNPYVYPHNDFLFWALELGLVGLLLFALFWSRLVAALNRLRRQGHARAETWAVAGVLVTMLVAELVDNGLFIRPIAERFFVMAGVLFAMSDAGR